MFEPLAKHHDKKGFDCGNVVLNHYLQTMASQHAKKGIAQTHILADGATIKAFYTLSNLHLNNDDDKIKGFPRLIPAILLGRMAVSVNYQGQNISRLMLAHALNKIKQLAIDTGICFVVIDAKTDKLADYYERLGFRRTDQAKRLILQVSKITEN